jgi:hypothetical protein
MVTTKTDIEDNIPTSSSIVGVANGETVTAEIENQNNESLLTSLILAYNWIIDQGVQLGDTNDFTGVNTFSGGIKVGTISPLFTNGDIILGLGTGGLYDDSVTPLNKYLFKSEIQTLINSSSGAVTMTGATSLLDGVGGLTPTPLAGEDDEVLKGDGTWGSILTANIADGAITAAKIADGTIIAADVMDDTLTTAKIISTSKTGTGSKLATATAAGTTNNLVSWSSNNIADSGISITQARAGQLVKVTDATLGSDSTVTATTVSYTHLTLPTM